MTSTQAPPQHPRTRARAAVAIVGGGASGTLTAVHLLRSSTDPGLTVRLYEPGAVHRGVAYSTTDARHLLNVRARDMSALPDEPGHLVEWAQRRGIELEPTDFLPRATYAEYLRDLVDQVCDDRLVVVRERVTDVVRTDEGFAVTAGGETAYADSVVLAHGNAQPRDLATADGPLPDAAWHLRSPWDLAALDAVPTEGTVVLVGSGLTAVDTAITLLEDAPARRVVMVSRRGELPKPHVAQTFTAWVTPVPDGPLTADGIAELVREQVAAAAAHDVDWRAVVDGLRGPTQSIWRRLDAAERERFLAAHARDWEVHRHRMAPEVAARIAAYAADGRLVVLGGGVLGVSDEGATARVRLDGVEVVADAVVNCTGPLTDVTRTSDPLLGALLERGTLAPDPLRLGVACTTGGQVTDAAGDLVDGLYVVGPPRKGVLWESTAVPEIRAQAAQLAQHLVARVSAV